MCVCNTHDTRDRDARRDYMSHTTSKKYIIHKSFVIKKRCSVLSSN